MSLWQAFLLGIVQGVAEFLPISSSGHLVIFHTIFKVTESALLFDVFLHFASLLAIVVFFWQRIKKITSKELVYLGLGTLPAVVVGLLLDSYIETLFRSLWIIGGMLMVTGGINFLSDFLLHKEDGPKFFRWLKKLTQGKDQVLTPKKAVIIGIFQSLALIPGISRSGATLLGGLTQKLGKEEAFNIAFLLALPAILGATGWQVFKLSQGFIQPVPLDLLLVGGFSTFVTSFLSLKILRKFVTASKFDVFGWYCLILGGGLAVISLF